MNKKRILSAVLVAALTLGTTTAFAQENGVSLTEETVEVSTQTVGDSFVVGDFKYTELEDGTLEVSCNNRNITIAEIPSTVNGKSVTSIGDNAFFNCTSLTSVTIPDSVTSIEMWAFGICSELTSVTIPNSVTSIGEDAFRGCSGLISVAISDGVTNIGGRAFLECSGLTSVTIPSSVTSIGEGAFYECSGLTVIDVGDGNTEYCSTDGILFNNSKTVLIQYPIGNKRTNYIIPNSVTNIGEDAFAHCSELTSLTIPNSVKNIGSGAFYRCSRLASVTIPNGVTCIGDAAFYFCSKLTSVTIPDSITSIGESAFEYCSSLTSVTIPDSVTSIGAGTFKYCSGLTSVTIPNGIASIGERAFQQCSLASVNIPNSVTSIGMWAFGSCSELTSVTIPDSVTNIENGAFANCSGLIAIDVSNGNIEYCSIDGVLFNKSKTVLIQYPGGDIKTSYIIPDGVTNIEDSAFFGCRELKSVTIPDGIISIGDSAFYDCKNLEDVYYSGTEEQWEKISIDRYNDLLLNSTIHYNSTGPSGTPVEVAIKAPTGVDTSNQTVTVTVNGETKILPIIDGLLDVSNLANGTYTFTFSAKNCAPRAYSNITVTGGTISGLSKVELNLYGDINVDGKINASDVLKAKLQAKGSQKLSDYDFAVADVTKDGKVNSTDILKLKLHAKGSSKLW